MTRDLAVQLYSLRQMAEKDFDAVLKTVADIGFKAVEPAGFWNMTPEEFLKRINDLGLKLYSSHSPWAKPDNLEETIDIAGRLGLDRVVCGYGPEDYKDLDAIKRTAETTSMMQEKLEKAGLMLFQHNHNWEFERIDGRLKYEIYAEGQVPARRFLVDQLRHGGPGRNDEALQRPRRRAPYEGRHPAPGRRRAQDHQRHL